MLPTSETTEKDSSSNNNKTRYCCYDDKAIPDTTPTPTASPETSATPNQTHTQPSFQHLFAFRSWHHNNSSSSSSTALLALGFASALSLGGLKTGLAVVLGKIFIAITNFGSGAASGRETLDGITHWSGVLAAAGAVAWLAYFGFTFAWVTFGEQQARLIRVRMLRVLLRKDMAWFDGLEDGVDSLLVRIQTYVFSLSSLSS